MEVVGSKVTIVNWIIIKTKREKSCSSQRLNKFITILLFNPFLFFLTLVSVPFASLSKVNPFSSNFLSQHDRLRSASYISIFNFTIFFLILIWIKGYLSWWDQIKIIIIQFHFLLTDRWTGPKVTSLYRNSNTRLVLFPSMSEIVTLQSTCKWVNVETRWRFRIVIWKKFPLLVNQSLVQLDNLTIAITI